MKPPTKYVLKVRRTGRTFDPGEYLEIAGQMYRVKKDYANKKDVQIIEVTRRKIK